jgi:hypothetical protein
MKVGNVWPSFKTTGINGFLPLQPCLACGTLLGGIAGYFAKREFESDGLMPKGRRD